MAEQSERLTGWGRTAATNATVVRPRSVAEVADAVRAAGARGVLARGLGRSYGDAAQNAGGTVLDIGALSEIGEVDPATGLTTCGAGLSIDALLRHCVPRGWFVPVTPGTRHVSLGGAVAADVHGKNHHRDGSLGRHLTELALVDGTGEVHAVRQDDELFAATLGGMGLTGVVTAVTLRMIRIESAWLGVDTFRTADLDETMATLHACDAQHRYSVAWLDCLAGGARTGRGVVTAGDHLRAADVPRAAGDPLHYDPRTRLAAPSQVPPRLLGSAPVALFNAAYHRRAPRRALDVPTSITAFFHPLDALARWNRLYGPRGFVQYQFATPRDETVVAALDALRRGGVPATLAVLKRFGAGTDAPLSFPMAGWTFAVDIPAGRPGLGAVLDHVDQLVLASGGRTYLAKDARTRPDVVAAMYPQLDRWRKARAAADPQEVFRSDLARRLHL